MSTPSPTPNSTTHYGGQGNSHAGDGGGPKLTPSTSLPFTFLITFVAIFLFFVGCGCGSRRYVLELRRTRHAQRSADDARERRRRSEMQRPVLWEVYPHDGGGKGWGDVSVQPLSATYARAPPAEVLQPRASSSEAPRNMLPPRPPPPTLYAELYDRFPTLRIFVRPPTAPPLLLEPAPQPPQPRPPVTAIQVAFVVAMPDPHRRLRPGRNLPAATAKLRRDTGSGSMHEKLVLAEAGDLGEYVIGMLEVPWREAT